MSILWIFQTKYPDRNLPQCLRPMDAVPVSIRKKVKPFMAADDQISGYLSVNALTIARALPIPASPSLITMEMASAT